MASVDDIFRNSKSITAPKRKLEDPTSSASYKAQPHKSAKLVNGASPHSSGQNGYQTIPSNPPSAAVNDEQDEDEDIEAGPARPTEEADEEIGDDDEEEGRFFGGGVTRSERQALDYLEDNDEDDAEAPEEVYDVAWLRRTAVSLQKKIDKNGDMRARYADQPQKFIQSEADLDDELKGLSILAEHGKLYARFAKTEEGGLESVVNLLVHENTDIAIRTVQLLVELTDEDIGIEPAQWKSLVQAAIKSGLLELLVSNLERLDEGDENDSAGVYRVLELLQNLTTDSSTVDRVASQKGLLPWLLSRIKQVGPDGPTKIDQNRQFAAEVFAIIFQGSSKARDTFITKLDGVDTLLQLLSVYRKHEPERNTDEEEFAENLFDGLTVVVDGSAGSTAFLEAEGVELCLIMLRESKFSKPRAAKVLDHALSGQGAVAACERFVEAAGLKTVFGLFMKSKSQGHRGEDREMQERLLSIIAALLRHTAVDSPARIRTLAKFVENDFGKINRLVELRNEYARRLARVEQDIDEEKQVIDADDQGEQEPEWFSRRVDAGLFVGQMIDVILAWMIAEDGGAAKRIASLLDGLTGVSDSLNDQIGGLDDGEVGASPEARATKEMLEALLRCVDGAIVAQ